MNLLFEDDLESIAEQWINYSIYVAYAGMQMNELVLEEEFVS